MGDSSYVEKKSTSSSTPGPPQSAQRKRVPGESATTRLLDSTDRYAKNDTEEADDRSSDLPLLREPKRRPSKRAQMRHRTSPRTQSRRSRLRLGSRASPGRPARARTAFTIRNRASTYI